MLEGTPPNKDWPPPMSKANISLQVATGPENCDTDPRACTAYSEPDAHASAKRVTGTKTLERKTALFYTLKP